MAVGDSALVQWLEASGWRTADGSPVAREPPFGVTVVVSRPGGEGAEYLVLHRAGEGPEHEGDWAWGPPAGARMPDEPIVACARRELFEETGLALDPRRVAHDGAEWALFAVVATADADLRLSVEHDGYAWLPLEDAAALCLPPAVAEQLRAGAAAR